MPSSNSPSLQPEALIQMSASPLIHTPKPLYHYPPDSEAGSSRSVISSRSGSNPSPSSTLVSSATTVVGEDDYGSKHFLDFATTLGKNSKYIARLNPMYWKRSQPKAPDFEQSVVETNLSKEPPPETDRPKVIYESGPQPAPSSIQPQESPYCRSWRFELKAALNTTDSYCRIRCVNMLISSVDSWTEEEMLDLATTLVSGVSNPTVVNIHDHYSNLCLLLYRSFSKVCPKDGYDQMFLTVLSNVVYSTFVYQWETVRIFIASDLILAVNIILHSQKHNPKAIVFERSPSIGRVQFVVSALAISKFIGSLYRVRLMSRSSVKKCLDILLNNASTAEHFVAIRLILANAGANHWRSCLRGDAKAELGRVKACISEEAKRVPCDRSLLVHPPPYNAVKSVVEYIHRDLDDFANLLDGK